jgi:hypothetical protein
MCVIPGKNGIQCIKVDIDSGFRRNDVAWDFLRFYHT